MAITIITNGAARNIAINGLASSSWTINGEAKDCRYSGGGLVDISGDATTPVDGLYVSGSGSGVLTISGSEQSINNVTVSTTSTVTLVSVTGSDNQITGLQMINTRATGLSVAGSRNKIAFNQQSNTVTTNTYDAVSVTGSDNRIEGLVNLEASNAYRYGVNASGDGNWTNVTADDAATAHHTDSGTGNRFFHTGQTYTPTNVTPDRNYDADATTLDELADVLGTLIADLQSTGIID
jgi:hypothetical protein